MINGITFDEQLITAANMAHFMKVFSGKSNGITRGCDITKDNNNMYISAGYFLIEGRQVQIIGTQTVPLASITSGEQYCTVVFKIDLSKSNTEDTFLQGTIETLHSTSAYPQPTQEDLEAGGQIFEYPIARYHATPAGADSFTVLAQAADVDWMSSTQFRLVQTADGYDLYID